MTDLKIMILIGLASLSIAEWSNIIPLIKWWLRIKGRIKPFDCAMCLTFWNTLGLFIYLHYGYYSILYAFANMALTILINKVYERLCRK